MDTTNAAETYVRERMLFMPRFLKSALELRPEIARAFADFYAASKRDKDLTRKVKELTFLAIGVAGASPACLIHVDPAVAAGATSQEVAEAALVGVLGAGFVPRGPGMPRAAVFLAEVRELERRHREQPEAPDYALPPRFGL